MHAVIANGDTVLIEGTVMDQSPAVAGTPCIADEDMTAWMEYLIQQKPCPEDVTRVPVLVQAFGSDGSVIDISTLTARAQRCLL